MLCRGKGARYGGDMEDWMPAERDLCFVPQSDMKETEASYEVHVAVPGFAVNEISVAVEPNQLTISGQSKKQTEDNRDGKTLLSEFSSKEMFRRFFLNNPIQADKVRANLDDGILQIYLPKATQLGEKPGIKVAPPPGKESKAAHAA